MKWCLHGLFAFLVVVALAQRGAGPVFAGVTLYLSAALLAELLGDPFG